MEGVFTDPVIANTILDGVLNRTHVIYIAGRCYGLKGYYDDLEQS